MCGFILYIFIYISQIFRTASPFLKTQEKQTKTKSSIAVYTTKETEKETSTTYCTILYFNVCDGVVMRPTALE